MALFGLLASPLPLALGDLLEPEPGLAIWTIVTFVLLLLGLWRFAWRPLLNALERREKTIRDAVESAQNLKDEAQKLIEQYKGQLQQAREEARAIVDEGRRDGDVLKKEILEKAREEQKEMSDRAQREIALATDAAVDKIRKESVNLSVDLTSKLVKKKLGPAEHQELIRIALKEIETKN